MFTSFIDVLGRRILTISANGVVVDLASSSRRLLLLEKGELWCQKPWMVAELIMEFKTLKYYFI